MNKITDYIDFLFDFNYLSYKYHLDMDELDYYNCCSYCQSIIKDYDLNKIEDNKKNNQMYNDL